MTFAEIKTFAWVGKKIYRKCLGAGSSDNVKVLRAGNELPFSEVSADE